MTGHTRHTIKVAILTTTGFERVELTEPQKAMEEAGFSTEIISDKEKITSWHKRQWWDEFVTDGLVQDTDPSQYHALLLPGGVINPDRLRRESVNIDFVRHFYQQKKPIAAICHGPQMLIEVDGVRNRNVTSFISLKSDLQNAGATWKDEEVVIDDFLITSRTPKDLPAFNRKLIQKLQEY